MTSTTSTSEALNAQRIRSTRFIPIFDDDNDDVDDDDNVDESDNRRAAGVGDL